MQNSFAIVPIKGIASPASKEKPIEGGKWKIVEEFNGRSHEDGGIDIEVSGGVVRRIHAPFHKPDVIAKKGSVWEGSIWNKDIKDVFGGVAAATYGFGEQAINTIFGDELKKYTDAAYNKTIGKMWTSGPVGEKMKEEAREKGAKAQTQSTNYIADKMGVTPEEGPLVGPPVEGPMPEMFQPKGMMPMGAPLMGQSDESPNLARSKTESTVLTGFGGGKSGDGSEQQFGESGGPIQFRQHPIYLDRTQAYLNRYGINV